MKLKIEDLKTELGNYYEKFGAIFIQKINKTDRKIQKIDRILSVLF